MNTSFEIIEPQVYQSAKRNTQAYSASTKKCIPFVAASLTVAMSMVAVYSYDLENIYNPIFISVESFHNDLSEALGKDYEVQAKLLQKLDKLKESLRNNWNGEEDCPIEEKAYVNAKIAITGTPSALLKYWRLFPNPNGTLLLSPKNKAIAGISIGNDEFSYAAFVSDDKQLSGREPFSEQSFKSALLQIHRILEYV